MTEHTYKKIKVKPMSIPYPAQRHVHYSIGLTGVGNSGFLPLAAKTYLYGCVEYLGLIEGNSTY